MIDNYNVIELLENFSPVDDIIIDILQELKQNDVLNGVKLA